MRWEFEQSPTPLTLINNPDLPLTAKTPNLGSEWGPRASVTWGTGESRWPTLRAGYGTYFGRTPNATFETALTQTGSLKGDLNFFMRPTDNLNAGGAPPFPYVFAGEPASMVKPRRAGQDGLADHTEPQLAGHLPPLVKWARTCWPHRAPGISRRTR